MYYTDTVKALVKLYKLLNWEYYIIEDGSREVIRGNTNKNFSHRKKLTFHNIAYIAYIFWNGATRKTQVDSVALAFRGTIS